MSTAPTLGVEEEYLVVDEVTRCPVPVGAATVAELSAVDFHPEFSPAQAELVTPMCANLDELRQCLLRGRHTLAAALRYHGALLLLGANSPFFDGQDTGHASWRTSVWARWPVTGVPPHFRSADEYEELVSRLVAAEVIIDAGMVYWYVRPSPHVPTVEVRVADVPGTVEETVLQAALTRALVTTALALGRPSPFIPDAVLSTACRRAAHVGLTGRCLDPFTGNPAPGWQLVAALLAHVRPALIASGDLDVVMSCLAWLRARGDGASRQRAALRTHGNMGSVVDFLATATTSDPANPTSTTT